MKSKIKRLLALVLCLTMVLNGNVSLLASDETTPEEQAVAEVVEEMTEEVAEEATEDVTEEVEEVEAVTEQPEVVEEEKTEEVVEEQIADNTKNDSLVLKTELNGTVITMSGPKSSFPEGTEYSVSASEISEEAISDVEASLRKVELETNEKIVSYKAFDIKLIVDGKEAQPVGDVNVTFQGKEVKEQVAAAENVEVYHVDEEKQVAVEVEGDVKNNEVVMTTDHFSTYVITTQNTSGVTVTVQHYLTSGNTKLYRDSQETLKVTERLEDISVARNYTVDKVVKMPGETVVTGADVITEDTTYRVYYSPTTGESTGTVQMFDYHVNKNAGTNSINSKSNYGDGAESDYKITSGKVDQNHTSNKYNVYVNGRNINAYTGGTSVVTGIITGVDYATGALKMANGKLSTTSDTSHVIYEPGFFTREAKIGKQILDNFTLKFDRTGDTYTLNSVWNGDTKASDAGSIFYPVDKIGADDDSANDYGHNHFFGLRYDVEFKIGDYVGPLTYSFSGDDDLWVVLDAKDDEAGGEVVVDLGGIHQKSEGSVDLWSALKLDKNSMTEDQKNKIHTLTVLYMERGAGSSNCNMTFTLPNSKVINSSVNPTSFAFTKVTSKDQPLAGAEFGLYNGTTLIDTVTSDTSGVVKFESLYPGTYTVKETKAPSGYVKDTTEYTLTVTKNTDNYVTSMTVAGSSAEVTKVTNYTQQEEAVKNITQNKTVTVLNENDRTFTINLSAATKGETQGTEAKGASIVLVLDASSSLSNDTFSSLKAGAIDFVAKVAEESPKSEIAIIWYQGGSTDASGTITDSNFYKLDNSNNLSSLNSKINSQNKSGGTPMDAALKAAYDKLGLASSENENKYVVFFTDGLPGWYDPSKSINDSQTKYNCKVANGAANYASQIKSSTGRNATIYTIGYGLKDSDYIAWTYNSNGSTEHTNHSHSTRTNGKNFLSNYIASSGKAYTASTNDALTQIFADIAGEVSVPYEVEANRIVDVIDPRFDLITTEEQLKAAYGEGVSISQTADGRTQIIWTGDSAIIRNEKDKEGPWNASFVVQAKPNFVGGNMIPTNGPESGIYVDSNTTIKFSQPSVNVKLLEPSLEDKIITVYKGDAVDSTAFTKELADSLKVTKLYNDAEEKISVIPTLTTEQLATLNSKSAVEVNYSYPDTTDIIGKFKFELTTNPSTLTPETNHVEAKSGTDVEVYTLKVTYIPDTVNERKSELSGIDEPTANGGTEVTTKTATADYIVNVISGEIQITKTLKEVLTEPQTFDFLVIKDQNSNDPIKVSITVPANQTSASVTLEDLARGAYTITEKDVDGYVLDGVEIITNLTNCQNSKVEAESVTFVLGNDASAANVIKSFAYNSADGGTLGTANFTNEKAYKDWSIVKRSSSNSSLVLEGAEFELKSETNTYKGISDENGVIVWYRAGSDTPLQSMEYIVKGTYTLRETKAPEGYSLTDLTWTVTVAAKGYLKSIECSEKEFTDVTIDKNGVFTCFIENTPFYELPQSGGLGIYTYTIGGILLMAFATLILYKNRRKEVLAR